MPLGKKGLNQFCNFLAACSDCNNDRSDNYPSDELIEYHMKVHDSIWLAGDYPVHAQRPSMFQFMHLEDLPDYEYVHRDLEEPASPFEILIRTI